MFRACARSSRADAGPAQHGFVHKDVCHTLGAEPRCTEGMRRQAEAPGEHPFVRKRSGNHRGSPGPYSLLLTDCRTRGCWSGCGPCGSAAGLPRRGRRPSGGPGRGTGACAGPAGLRDRARRGKAGSLLWYVLDLDATIVPCTSAKEGMAGTFKGSFGRMPLGRGWPTPVSASRCCRGPATRRPQERSGRCAAAAPAAALVEVAGRIDGAAFTSYRPARPDRLAAGDAADRAPTDRINQGKTPDQWNRSVRRRIEADANPNAETTGSRSRPPSVAIVWSR